MTESAIIYSCPECKKDVASGILYSLKVICPHCAEFIVMDAKKDLKGIGKKASKRTSRKTYGRDRLTIVKMQTSKNDAMKKGDSHYFTGQPCRNGHISVRNKKGECHECCRVWRVEYIKNNGDRIKASQERFAAKKRKQKLAKA